MRTISTAKCEKIIKYFYYNRYNKKKILFYIIKKHLRYFLFDTFFIYFISLFFIY